MSLSALAVSGCAATAVAPSVPLLADAEDKATATSLQKATTLPPTTTTTTTQPAPTITTTTAPPAPPTAIVRACPHPEATPPPVGGEPVSASVAVTHSIICGTTDIVVATAEEADGLPSRMAATIGAPLVYASTERPYDPARLGAARVWTTDAALVTAGSHAILPLADQTTEEIPYLVASVDKGVVTKEAVGASIEAASEAPTLVVVSPQQPQLAASAAAAAAAVDGTTVWSAPGDMRRRRSLASLAENSAGRFLVGDFSLASSWQLDVLAAGKQLPGGGQVLFPDKRLVALYGHPQTSVLGVLGEQPVAEAVTRAADLAAPYGTDDVPAIPTFELIATTASSRPGEDGDYSAELSVDELRPWVEMAAEAGLYVVLDLQPGRTDFLTQAKRYEELLRLPHVGLALDPEWRLGPDQFHLRQIGSVSAGEVNTVVSWLADLVRRERLPQKLLLVHQFKLSMISERDQIETPSELAVVIQMDGQGPLGTKNATWDTLVAAGNNGWGWGWKNFYDEDSPTPTPQHVMGLDPLPVFVSYQ
ncbi:MAG TPA: hypothetical protein VHL52_02485 [Acidimicrobiia bacterium]|nr:hypothetical protein [Acidimicrobiia bacterium]